MNSILKMLYTFLMFVSEVSQILILVLKQTKALSFLEKKTQGFCNLSGLNSGHLCALVTGVNVRHRVSTALRFIQ